MSMSLDVKLIYGWKLGGAEDDWKELGLPYDPENYTYKWPAWVKLNDAGDPDEEHDGFIGQAAERLAHVLVRSVGFYAPEPDWETERAAWQDWVHAHNAARKKAGLGLGDGMLDFVYGGVSAYQDAYLGIRIASDIQDIPLDPRELATLFEANHTRWNDRLKTAANVLDIKPAHIPQLWVTAKYS